MNLIAHALTRLGEWAAHPAAFLLVVAYVAAWLIFDAKSFGWTGATEIIVLLMTLFIVRAEFRDTQAIHAKLDKILEGQGQASEDITSLDHRGPEEIEEHRHRGQARAEQRPSYLMPTGPLPNAPEKAGAEEHGRSHRKTDPLHNAAVRRDGCCA